MLVVGVNCYVKKIKKLFYQLSDAPNLLSFWVLLEVNSHQSYESMPIHGMKTILFLDLSNIKDFGEHNTILLSLKVNANISLVSQQHTKRKTQCFPLVDISLLASHTL